MPVEAHNRLGLKHITLRAQQEVLVRFNHSRLLTPLPSSPLGYQLQLIANEPRHLTPKEQDTAQGKIRNAVDVLQQIGATNNVKVNITRINVVPQKQPDGSTHQVIQYTTAPSTYFEHRVAIDRTTPYETARKLTHSGATMVAITGDGMIALSSRQEQAIFPRTWDTTSQGSWDGTLQENTAQPLLVPPTPEKAKGHILKETEEEVGIPKAVLERPETQLTVLGMTEDAVKKHWDFIWLMRLPRDITAQKMRFFHNEARNGNLDPNDPIAGHITFIQANPSAIEHFLVNMRSPSAPIAREALLLTGYMLRMQEGLAQGQPEKKAMEKARQWMTGVERQVALRQIRIDFNARAYRREKLFDARKAYVTGKVQEVLRRPGAREKVARAKHDIQHYRRLPRGYNPHGVPSSQRLPETKDELIRNGFIPSDAAFFR